MKTSFLLIALATLIAGCAPSQTVWHREGSTSDELKLAQRDCARDAEKYGFVFESGRSGDDLSGGERRGRRFRLPRLHGAPRLAASARHGTLASWRS